MKLADKLQHQTFSFYSIASTSSSTMPRHYLICNSRRISNSYEANDAIQFFEVVLFDVIETVY